MKNKAAFGNATLNEFISSEWDKVLGYLGKTYMLSRDDCQDIFQDSFLVLHKNVAEGVLENLRCSLSTYFIGICRNKAMEKMRGMSKMSVKGSDESLSLLDGEFRTEKIDALIALDDGGFEEEKQRLVDEIVDDLPSPCNELLWGFYRDGLSMKTLAGMYGYSEGSVKVVKHRCTEKFKARYQMLEKKLFLGE